MVAAVIPAVGAEHLPGRSARWTGESRETTTTEPTRTTTCPPPLGPSFVGITYDSARRIVTCREDVEQVTRTS